MVNEFEQGKPVTISEHINFLKWISRDLNYKIRYLSKNGTDYITITNTLTALDFFILVMTKYQEKYNEELPKQFNIGPDIDILYTALKKATCNDWNKSIPFTYMLAINSCIHNVIKEMYVPTGEKEYSPSLLERALRKIFDILHLMSTKSAKV